MTRLDLIATAIFVAAGFAFAASLLACWQNSTAMLWLWLAAMFAALGLITAMMKLRTRRSYNWRPVVPRDAGLLFSPPYVTTSNPARVALAQLCGFDPAERAFR